MFSRLYGQIGQQLRWQLQNILRRPAAFDRLYGQGGQWVKLTSTNRTLAALHVTAQKGYIDIHSIQALNIKASINSPKQLPPQSKSVQGVFPVPPHTLCLSNFLVPPHTPAQSRGEVQTPPQLW